MKKLLAVLMILTLSACAPYVPPPEKPLRLSDTSYRINASRIDVIDDYTAGVSHKADSSLAAAMHKWAAAKLTYGGTANIFELHITDASIAKTELGKKKTGLEGLFTKEQTEEYNGKLTVELKLYTPERTLPVAHAEITAEQMHTLREDANVEDRKALYRQITNEIMTQMDPALDRNIRTYFANYLM